MSPKKKQSRLKIAGSVWMFATVLSVITGAGFPGILNYVDRNDFSSPQIEVQGLYIRPSIEGGTYGFTFPLLYSYCSNHHPPYSIRIAVTDSEGGKQCRKLVIEDLIVTVKGKSKEMIKRGESMSSSFDRYLSGHTGITARCNVDLGEIISTEDTVRVQFEATVKIHTANGVIAHSVSSELKKQQRFKGFWFIWEALSPD
ncbi:MAG: hypothetical protein ACKVHE_18145 [Planctomycetales bacterium]|jgi:hypothetical protein